LCFVSAACAQEDDQKAEEAEESKRPSWSAGLPEREKPADLNKPTFKPDRDEEIELDMSEFGLQPKPEIEIELPINSGIAGMPVGNPKEQAENAAEEQAVADQAAAEQAAIEEAAAEQAAIEQASAEQAAIEQAAAEQAAIEQAEAEQAAIEQALAEQAAIEQAEAEQAATEQALADQAAIEQAAAEQAAIEQALAEEASQSVDDADNDASSQADQEVINLPEESSIASIEPAINNDASDVTAADEAEYSWNVLSRAPVQYPVKAAIDNLEGWVEVEITINPAGEVVSVSPVDYSRRGRIFGKPAVQSVKDWLFEPPSSIGITTNITRIYKVEFNL
jgi:TonB family protein